MMYTDRRNRGIRRWRFTRWCHDLIGRLYRAPIGVIFRILLVVALGLFPIVRNEQHVLGVGWLTVWCVVFAAREIGDRYLSGLGSLNLRKRIARINRDIGGNINAVARYVVPEGSQKKPGWLSEEQAHTACMSLLARVLDFTLNEYPQAERSDVRVTLAVPVTLAGSVKPVMLRVWCYDRPHDDSHWTELRLPLVKGEEPLAGAPDAFVSNEVRVVADIRTVNGTPGVENRRYRSIVSIPVTGGGPSGKPCAVVNIDAATENFFAEDAVWERILPLATPILSTISFVLRLRTPGSPYKFGN